MLSQDSQNSPLISKIVFPEVLKFGIDNANTRHILRPLRRFCENYSMKNLSDFLKNKTQKTFQWRFFSERRRGNVIYTVPIVLGKWCVYNKNIHKIFLSFEPTHNSFSWKMGKLGAQITLKKLEEQMHYLDILHQKRTLFTQNYARRLIISWGFQPGAGLSHGKNSFQIRSSYNTNGTKLILALTWECKLQINEKQKEDYKIED